MGYSVVNQFYRAFSGFFDSAAFALGDGTGAGRAAGTGLAIAAMLCWPRALASRVTRELSIPASALAGARMAAIVTGWGADGRATGRGVLVTAEGCFGATGAGTG